MPIWRERRILKELVEMTLRARGDCYHTCLVQIGITSYMCLVTETEKMEGRLVDSKDVGQYIKGNPGIWVQITYRDYLLKLND